MKRGKVYSFRPYGELKQLFGKKSKERLLARKYHGGVVLKLFADDDVLIAPMRLREHGRSRSGHYCIRIQSAAGVLVIDCEFLHKIRVTALLDTADHEGGIPHEVREEVYRVFGDAKQHRNTMHERLHDLKRQIELGKMNNTPRDRLRGLEEQFSAIACALGYQEVEVTRKRLAPLKTYNRKPLQGGRFSPR